MIEEGSERRFNVIYTSYYFPPIQSIAVKRNFYIAKALFESGNHVDVLTTTNQDLFPKEEILIEGIKINKLFTFDYRTILSILKPNKGSIHFSSEYKQHPIIKWLIKVNESLPFNIFLGEGGLIYILHGLIKTVLKLVKNRNNSSIIISSFRPTSNVLIGYLTKLFFPRLNWVVSFHDVPYLEKRKNLVLLSFQDWIWKKLLKKSDLVLAVSHGVGVALQRYNCKAFVLENGVVLRQPHSAKNQKFIIVFTGSLYSGLIDPGLLFNALEVLLTHQLIKKDLVEIIYAGKDSKEWEFWCENYPMTKELLIIKGLISNENALKLQEEANINVMLTWNDKSFSGNLTGKFYEYLGARNPILCIVKGAFDTEIEHNFKKFNCGKIIYESYDKALQHTIDYILQMYTEWSDNSYEKNYISVNDLEGATWSAKAKTMNGLFKNCINKN
jgi:hypothetical protein